MSYGALTAVPVGSVFPSRAALQASGFHRDREGGIIGRVDQLGAESVVINRPGNGYGDDLDHGALVIYPGHGGPDRASGRQIDDQHFTHRNKTLARNSETGQPVRVHRQIPEGFRYDGLYAVESAWRSLGRDGYAVCRFRLRRIDDAERSSPTSSVGAYAEGAHILPLGGGYNGPDLTRNVLCLCPNCHIQLDHGGLFVTDELDAVDATGSSRGSLRTHPDHHIDIAAVRAQRSLFDFTTPGSNPPGP